MATPEGRWRLLLGPALPPGEARPRREPQNCLEALPPAPLRPLLPLSLPWSTQRSCWPVVGSIVYPGESTRALVLGALVPLPPAWLSWPSWVGDWGIPQCPRPQVEGRMLCRAGWRTGWGGGGAREAGTLGPGGGASVQGSGTTLADWSSLGPGQVSSRDLGCFWGVCPWGPGQVSSRDLGCFWGVCPWGSQAGPVVWGLGHPSACWGGGVSQKGRGLGNGRKDWATWAVRQESGPSQVSVAALTQRLCSPPAGLPGGLAPGLCLLAAAGRAPGVPRPPQVLLW